MKFKKLLNLTVLFCVILSCEKQPDTIAVTGITLSQTALELMEGESATITATVSPSNATNKRVLWTSDNPYVTVENGTISAHSRTQTRATAPTRAGSTDIAIITATSDDGGKTAICKVTILPKPIPVTDLLLNRSSIELTEGEQFTIKVSIVPANASDPTILWSSSNPSVASVSDGIISAEKAGEAVISAKCGDIQRECSVKVKQRTIDVQSVSLDKTTLTLDEGESETLTATITPADASDKTVRWSSADENIATVNQEGTVTAVGVGTTTITASAGGKEASCTVTVTEKYHSVESISLNQTQAKMMVDDEVTLVATISPENANNKTIVWSSDNPSVATVQNGTVKALSLGKANITATTEEGNKTATCSISVVGIDEMVSASFYSMDLGSGSLSYEGSYVKLTKGVKLSIALSNYSTRPISVTGLSLTCAKTGTPVTYNIEENQLDGGRAVTYTVTLFSTMYSPTAQYTYIYDGQTFTVSKQFTGSIGF